MHLISVRDGFDWQMTIQTDKNMKEPLYMRLRVNDAALHGITGEWNLLKWREEKLRFLTKTIGTNTHDVKTFKQVITVMQKIVFSLPMYRQ